MRVSELIPEVGKCGLTRLTLKFNKKTKSIDYACQFLVDLLLPESKYDKKSIKSVLT